MKYLRFDSEQAMVNELQAHLYNGNVPSYIGTVAVDVVGVIHQPTGAVIETAYCPIPEFAPIPGWHVNLSAGVPELERFEIPTPSHPSRVFSATPEPVRVPQEVTMAQCRLALFDQHAIESDDEFYALVDLLPETERARALLELRTRPTVRRDHALVQVLGQAMGWDLDALFIYAGGL